MADTTTELEVLNQIVDVLGGTSGQYETVVPVLQQIKELLAAGITDPEAIAEAVTAWLDEHPEATTTVQDGSITDAKLAQTGGVLEAANTGMRHIYTDLTSWYYGYIDARGVLVPSTPSGARAITPTNVPFKIDNGKSVIVDCGSLECGVGLYTYNASTQTFARYSNANYTDAVTITADNDNTYCALTFKTIPQAVIAPSDFDGSISTQTVLYSHVISNTVRIVALENAQEQRNVLYGKKLVACGDSITAATNPNGGNFDNYANLTAQRNGMTYDVNAVNGSTMSNVAGKNPFCVDRYLTVTDFDYLTIFFGWNDSAYASVGTMSDTTDTTFYGAYKKVLEHFLTTYPTKKIGLVVPYGPSPSIEPFQQAVRDLSEAYGVPCLDLPDYNQCSLLYGTENSSQLARRSALTYDGTHPNQDGHYFLSTMYERFLLSL